MKKFEGRVNFSQTFNFRKMWLFIVKNNFNQSKIGITENEYLKLGLGKNMVSSLKGWLSVFDLYSEKEGTSKLINLIEDDFGNSKLTKLYLHLKMTNLNKATFWYFVFCIYENNIIDEMVIESFSDYMLINFNKVYSEKSLKREYLTFINHFCKSASDVLLNESFFVGLELLEKKENKYYKNTLNLSLLNDTYFYLFSYFINSELGNEFSLDQLEKNRFLNKINIVIKDNFDFLYEMEKRKFFTIVRSSNLNIITLKKYDTTEEQLIERLNNEIF